MAKTHKANFTLNKETITRLKEYSNDSMIPQSRIVDKAINDFIDKQENN